MLNPRRKFITKMLTGAGILALKPSRLMSMTDIVGSMQKFTSMDPKEAAKTESLWVPIQQAFTASANIINLNNGGVSPQPKIVQDAVDRYYHLSNEAPSYYMWRILDQGRESLRMKLADLAGCQAEELAVNRNATESLDTVIFGMDLKKGDEVILTKQDYPNMINAWKQREIRDGIKLKWLNFELPIENDHDFVNAFAGAITPATRVLHITHMINWTGQILPAGKLCDLAREKGLVSVVDGAHTFAHMDFKIPDLHCDYFGTSLHKWLCAPFGTGLLYVRKPLIGKTWPLIPNHEPQSDDIRKFEGLGTRSFAPEQAIGQAINFHNAIGAKVKEERLRYLKNYWIEKVVDLPKVKINTSMKDEYACALANFSVEGVEPVDLHNKLFGDYKIHTSPIVWENISGVRITPHVYTPLKDLDRLVEAIHTICS